jgi:hypothetical protein
VAVRRRLKRYYGAGDFHFITCSCYRRQPLLGTPGRRDLFLTVLEQVRRRYHFVVAGYVIMPEHVHLLIGRVPLDKSEGSVKDKDILCRAEAPLSLPERFEDQDSGNLTLNHFSAELVVPPTIDSA